MFVPMKENWVNYLMAKKPHIMGERSPKDTFQLGGMSPNIEQLSWPPEQSKFSADQFHRMVKEGIDRGVKCVEDWAQGVMPMISAAIMKSARFLFREAKKGTSLDMDKVASAPLQAVLAGHRADRLFAIVAVDHEERINQSIRCQSGLAYQAAEHGRLAQTPRTTNRAGQVVAVVRGIHSFDVSYWAVRGCRLELAPAASVSATCFASLIQSLIDTPPR